jgi:hypothetical protein
MRIPLNDTLQPLETIPLKGEAAEQARLVAALRKCWKDIEEHLRPLIFAIPNGGSRDAREGANLKVSGVLAGMPDIQIALPDRKVIWVEMKVKGGRVSDNQRDVHNHLSALGHMVVVAYSAEEALNKLREVANGT